MEVLSYQPHSKKYSPFPHDELLPTGNFRTPSSSNPTSRQSSIPDQNEPSDGVSQLREADDVNGDESSDDELPSLQKLLSPTTPFPANPPRSYSFNRSVQTARSSAMTLPSFTSTPRKRLLNYPEWSIFHPSAQISQPKFKDEANNGNSQENPTIIDDHDDGVLTDRFDHTSHQMTVNDPGVVDKNTDGDVGGAAHTGEGVTNFDPDDVAMSQGDDRLAIATSTSFSPEIPESESAVTCDEERQLNPSVQGDPTPSPSAKRSRSLSGSVRADGHGSGWVFDVFAEDDSETEGDGLPPSKRVRSSPPPLKAVENRSSPVATVAVKPRSDQEYEVHQIVGESELEYEVTAVTKIWLPEASVGRKLVRKYRAERRAATRVQTRRSSRLQNKK